MGDDPSFANLPWAELEARLSDGRAPRTSGWNDGGDGPAFGAKRQPYVAPMDLTGCDDEPYAELHCRSNFSFLRGVAHPEQLVETAVALGLRALALTDRNGLYGVVRFAEAARALDLPTVFGAEIACPEGDLVVLARSPRGYAHLSSAISAGQLAGEKGAPQFTLAGLGEFCVGEWRVLTGGASGVLASALHRDGPAAAEHALRRLISTFGRDHLLVELWDHGDPLDSVRNDELVRLAHRHDVECVATNDVSYATVAQHRLATAVAAVSRRTSLDVIDPDLPPAATAYVRSGSEQRRRFARYPGVVARTVEVAMNVRSIYVSWHHVCRRFPAPRGWTR